jgi:cytochrome c
MLVRTLAFVWAIVAVQAAAAQPPDAANVERVWTKCSACHSRDGTSTGVGPNLGGLSGRPAGRLKGYKYSSAFRHATFVWDAARLDAFLSDPQKVVPGTAMAFSGLRDARDRALLVCLLLETCGSQSSPNDR